jgi:hypothetical protein
MLPIKPVDNPIARSSENVAMSFLNTTPTQPIKNEPTCHPTEIQHEDMLQKLSELCPPRLRCQHRDWAYPFTFIFLFTFLSEREREKKEASTTKTQNIFNQMKIRG